MEYLIVLTTIDNLEDAKTLAQDLVAIKLAACAQITPIESFYQWQGELCHDQEFQLKFKTLAKNYAALEQEIIKRHSYDLPQIYAIPFTQCYAPYGDWIRENSQPG